MCLHHCMKLMNCKKRRKNCRNCCIFVLFSAQLSSVRFGSVVSVCVFKCIVCIFVSISSKIVTWIATHTYSLWLTPSLHCAYVCARRHRFITTEEAKWHKFYGSVFVVVIAVFCSVWHFEIKRHNNLLLTKLVWTNIDDMKSHSNWDPNFNHFFELFWSLQMHSCFYRFNRW